MSLFASMYVHYWISKTESSKIEIDQGWKRTPPPTPQAKLLKKSCWTQRNMFPIISDKRSRSSPRVRPDNSHVSTDRIEQPVSRGTRQAGKNVGRQTFSRDTESRLRMHARSKTTASGTTGSAYRSRRKLLKVSGDPTIALRSTSPEPFVPAHRGRLWRRVNVNVESATRCRRTIEKYYPGCKSVL